MSIANRKANGIDDKLDEFITNRSVGTPFVMAQICDTTALSVTRLLDLASDGHDDERGRLQARLNLNLMLSRALPYMRRKMSASMRKHAMGLVA